MKTVYLDVSSLLMFPNLTGIQRVVIEVVLRLIGLQRSVGFELVLLQHDRDFRFFQCDNDAFAAYYGRTEGKKTDCVTKKTVDIDHLATQAFWLDLDSVWANMIPRHALYPQLAKRNIRIGVYVYDVIVLSYPQFTSADNQVRFPDYIGAVFDWADCIFTEAESTRAEIEKLAREVGCTRQIQYIIATPGADFARRGEVPAGHISEQVRRIAERGKILLTVSTLEIRKNHWVLLDAFDLGLRQMGFQMVFVGNAGWKVDDLLARIKTHPERGKSLYHLQGIDDEELRYLYEHAQFVLFPSYTEGYGLATVEAMQYGVPVILSDVPIMREVGGTLCDYFAPDAPERLVEIIRGYEREPARYKAKRAALKDYRAPNWDDCARAVLDGMLEESAPRRVERAVEQIVYLSARADELLTTLEHVEAYIPFIRRMVLICPDSMAAEMKERYTGKLSVSYVTYSELLQGRPLPEDHSMRSFLLRCLAMSRPELDEAFIMSDDGYRPLRQVEQSFFLRDGRYQAFYFHDLDRWLGDVTASTSYDMQMQHTNAFLKAHGLPDLQYDCHMPQIICKSWYQQLLREYPGLEEEGCDAWSTYFNFIVDRYPASVEVRPYVTLCWPGSLSDWDMLVTPPEFVFEDFCASMYGQGGSFSGMHPSFGPWTEQENEKKIRAGKRLLAEHARRGEHWRGMVEKYSARYGQEPSFVFCCGEGVTPGFACMPAQLELLAGMAYSFPVHILRKDSAGRWLPDSGDIRIGYGWEEDEICTAGKSLAGESRALIRVRTPLTARQSSLCLYWAENGGEYTLAGKMPISLVE